MSDNAIREEPLSRRGSSDPVDDETYRNIRQLAEGRFRAGQEELRVGLVQALAAIDQDHMSRGLYTCSARLSFRRAEQMKHLRSVLDLRVRSVIDAHKPAGYLLDRDARGFIEREIHRLCVAQRMSLGNDLAVEVDRSQLGGDTKRQFTTAIARDIAREGNRASELLRTEAAQLELLHNRSKMRGETEAHSIDGKGSSTDPRLNIFARDGEVWRVSFRSKSFSIKDRKGMGYLQKLMMKPKTTVSVSDLIELRKDFLPRHAEAAPFLDEDAYSTIRKRLADLDSDIKEAADEGGEQHQEALETERAKLLSQLKAATRKGGRARLFPAEADRVRQAVGNAMQEAITAIARLDPELATHLRSSIRGLRGNNPRYDPEPLVSWSFKWQPGNAP